MRVTVRLSTLESWLEGVRHTDVPVRYLFLADGLKLQVGRIDREAVCS